MVANEIIAKFKDIRQSGNNLKEVTELIEVSRMVFHEKIVNLQSEIMKENDQKRKKEIIEEIEKIYEEYQETFWFIENCIDEYIKTTSL